MLKFSYIKLFLLMLIISFIVGCMPHIKLEHTSTPMKEPIVKGKVVMGSINNLRENGLGNDNFELMGNLRGGFGNPIRFYTDEGYGINVALNKLLKDALFLSGYEVQASSSGKDMGILETDVLTFWCDGHTTYHITSKIKLKLFSYDKRQVLLEKELKNEREVGFGSSSNLNNAYQILMNEILKDSVDFFRSEEFNKALK